MKEEYESITFSVIPLSAVGGGVDSSSDHDNGYVDIGDLLDHRRDRE